MEQEQLTIFIQSMIDYFNKIADSPIDVGVPFLKKAGQNILLHYTGAIGISGKMRGAIYITADEDFLYELLKKIMPGIKKEKGHLSSMVGELANTIAGNAQKTLGKEFLISIPMILTNPGEAKESTFELQAPTFIIPFKWLDYQAFLAVGLSK